MFYNDLDAQPVRHSLPYLRSRLEPAEGRAMSRDFRKARRAQIADRLGEPMAGGITLSCGCTTNREPELVRPVRWWCCDAWRKRKAHK